MRPPRRVVLDSNVIVSALLFGGNPRRVLESALEGTIRCSISLAMLVEVRDVLQRSKFGLSPLQVLGFMEELNALCEVIDPPVSLKVVASDPDDNRVLECALAAGAECIVSGDADLLELKKWRGVDILTPADFVRRLMDDEED